MDYNFYLSSINQGKNGYFLIRNMYTSEKTSPTLFYIFFIFVGKIAALFHLLSFQAYHLVRIVLVELYVILLFMLSTTFLGKKNALWGSIFLLFATVCPEKYFMNKLNIYDYAYNGVPFWYNFDALERLNALPHHIFGQNVLLLCVILLILYQKRKSIYWKYLLLASFFLFIGIIVFPSIMIPFGFSLPIAYVLFHLKQYIFSKKTTNLGRNCVMLFFFLLPVGLGFVIFNHLESLGFQCYSRAWEVYMWNNFKDFFNHDMIYVFGFTPLLAIPAFCRNFIKGKIEEFFINIWAISPFLLLPLVNYISFPKIRLIDHGAFIPFALLSIQSFGMMNHFFRNIIRDKGVGFMTKLTFYCYRFSFLLFFFVSTIPVIIQNYIFKINAFTFFIQYNEQTLISLSPSTIAGFTYMDSYLPLGATILSSQRMGQLIPAFTKLISFTGHTFCMIDYNNKFKIIDDFYLGKYTNDQAYKMIKMQGIQYVYFGREEKKLTQKVSYSFLQSIYKNDEVEVFKVK